MTDYHTGEHNLWIVFNSQRNFTVITLKKYEQKRTISLLFVKHYSTFWVKQRTYYTNVTETSLSSMSFRDFEIVLMQSKIYSR